MIILRKILLWACFIGCALFIYPNICRSESQQTSGVTAQSIVDRARDYLAETSTAFYGDGYLHQHLKAGVLDIVARTKCMEGVTEVYLQTGTSGYSISSNYLSISRAVYAGTTTDYNDNPYYELAPIEKPDIGHNEDLGTPARWYTWNDWFYVDPIPASGASGNYVYLYYVERPTGMTTTYSAVETPAKYDYALTLFVVGRALMKARQFGSANIFMQEYQQELDRFRGDTKESDK